MLSPRSDSATAVETHETGRSKRALAATPPLPLPVTQPPAAFNNIPEPDTFSLVTSPTTAGVRKAAIAILLIIFVISMGIMPFVGMPLPAVQPFLPIFSTSIIIGDVLTGLMLIQQARLVRRPCIMMLSCAYILTAMICAFQLPVMPGVFAPAGLVANSSNAAVFLWIIWHAFFPLFVTGYAMLERHPLMQRTSNRSLNWILALPMAIFLAAVGFVLFLPDWLPVLAINGSFKSVAGRMALVVVSCNLLAVVVLPWRTHLKHRLEVWLWVASVASLLDVTVTLMGGARYSVGWYVARIDSLAASMVVLIAFQAEMARLYMALIKLNNQLARMVSRDGLTGLANRRHFDAVLTNEWQRCQRQQQPISFLMIDVDHFKHFNDSLGHPAGDSCLRMVAATLAKIVGRPADLVARYGGEEFCLLLPGTTPDGAMNVAERARKAIKALNIFHPHGLAAVVTASVGAATLMPEAGGAQEQLLVAADKALYAAKRSGRNRCVHFDAMPPEPEPETDEQDIATFCP